MLHQPYVHLGHDYDHQLEGRGAGLSLSDRSGQPTRNVLLPGCSSIGPGLYTPRTTSPLPGDQYAIGHICRYLVPHPFLHSRFLPYLQLLSFRAASGRPSSRLHIVQSRQPPSRSQTRAEQTRPRRPNWFTHPQLMVISFNDHFHQPLSYHDNHIRGVCMSGRASRPSDHASLVCRENLALESKAFQSVRNFDLRPSLSIGSPAATGRSQYTGQTYSPDKHATSLDTYSLDRFRPP